MIKLHIGKLSKYSFRAKVFSNKRMLIFIADTLPFNANFRINNRSNVSFVLPITRLEKLLVIDNTVLLPRIAKKLKNYFHYHAEQLRSLVDQLLPEVFRNFSLVNCVCYTVLYACNCMMQMQWVLFFVFKQIPCVSRIQELHNA